MRPAHLVDLEMVCFLADRDVHTRDSRMPKEPNWRIALLAVGIVFLDQLTKLIVQYHLSFGEQREVVKGFFRFVHWQNTGAAWSMFTGNNGALAIVAIVAL